MDDCWILNNVIRGSSSVASASPSLVDGRTTSREWDEEWVKDRESLAVEG